jgi:hypothetical protein
LFGSAFAFFDHIREFIGVKELDAVFEFRDDGNDLGVVRKVVESLI